MPPIGARRAETVLGQAYVLFRLGGLLQILVAVWSTAPVYRPLAWGLVLLTAVLSWSSVLCVVALKRRAVPAVGWIGVGSALLAMAMAMVASAALAHRTEHSHTWVFFMYPFALLAVVGFGLCRSALVTVLGLVAVVVLSYLSSATFILGDPLWNVLPNGVPYLANAAVAWTVARAVRRSGVAVDVAAAATAAREGQLAAERERAHHARLLHDRVLQTMELLATGPWVSDGRVRGLVAEDAAWLRSFVRGERPSDTDRVDLVTGLEQLAARQAAVGLHVTVHVAQLHAALAGRALPDHLPRIVLDVVAELLTNIAKHAGVDAAVVRAALADGCLTVTVLDNGVGFDPTTVSGGLGLTRSVHAPVTACGGRAVVESAAGSGTFVTIDIPVDGRSPSPPVDTAERTPG